MNTAVKSRVVADLNKPLNITLLSPSSTGFDWNPEYNSRAFRLILKNRSISRNRRRLGAANKVTFRFQPLTPGNHKITFILQRPWDSEISEEKHFYISVK